jgi:hypothetical protein
MKSLYNVCELIIRLIQVDGEEAIIIQVIERDWNFQSISDFMMSRLSRNVSPLIYAEILIADKKFSRNSLISFHKPNTLKTATNKGWNENEN